MTVRMTGPRQRRGQPRIDRRLLRSRAARLLRELPVPEADDTAKAELSVALVDDEEIASLNAKYRGVARPTDVLAFSLLEGRHAERRGALLGDVVIGIETAARQARRRRRSLDDEVARLLIHGTLHLLGHDHRRRAEARAMRAEERRLWSAIRG
jgi:probable rRNA maturation factor